MSQLTLQWSDGSVHILPNVNKNTKLDEIKTFIALNKGVDKAKIKAWTVGGTPLVDNYKTIYDYNMCNSTIIMATEWTEQPAQQLRYYV